MAGFLIASGHIEVDADVQDAMRNIGNLVTKMTLVGPVAIAAGAATAAAVGGITAAFSAAGAAVGAFGLAAKPQLTEVTEVTKLYEEAQKAAADGAADATQKQQAYEKALAKLPPATRDTATALSALKTEHKEWSDSLASSTMPVYTKGINMLRSALPKLTPFVRIASFQFKQFLDTLGEGQAGAVFREFAKGAQHHAGGSLNNFLTILKNIAVGFVGILNAFMPMSVTMSGGLADLTAKFAAWGAQLGQSSGFKTFIDYVKTNGPIIAQTLGSIAVTVGKLVMALAPLAGITLPALAAIAEFVSKLPPPVILAIAAAITALKIALLGFRIASMLTGTAMWPLITATWAWTAALLANPVTWIILGILALVAVIVVIATKTDWFQRLWKVCWNAIKVAASAAWEFIKTVVSRGFNFLKNLFLNFTGPGLLIKHWNTIKSATSAAWQWVQNQVTSKINAVRSTISTVTGAISSRVSSAWSSVKSATSAAWSWIKSIITSGINGARNAVASAVSGISSTVSSIRGRVVGALSGAASFLYNAGQSIIRGLINGIKSMAGSVKSAVGGVLSGARDLLPFSPAKEGPFSGKGWTEYSGAALMQGLATGIDKGAGIPAQSMSSALGGVSGVTTPQPVGATGSTYNINLSMDFNSMALPSPSERRAFAKAFRQEINDELRNMEKERR
ncbi:hypothetical protein OHS59_16205 [Streptomyces sp. NBC_00414]|uniref:phage tail protein n=1 Tax=Streptomyces sp. NBC_00414 TaxID=2975739 RepID=UPI002E208067